MIGATSLPLLDRRVNNVTSNLINLDVLDNNKITVKAASNSGKCTFKKFIKTSIEVSDSLKLTAVADIGGLQQG